MDQILIITTKFLIMKIKKSKITIIIYILTYLILIYYSPSTKSYRTYVCSPSPYYSSTFSVI